MRLIDRFNNNERIVQHIYITLHLEVNTYIYTYVKL